MADMNINGVNNLQNTNLTKTEKVEQQPEEIMVFGAVDSESQGKIKKGLVTDIYRGNIAGKDFDLLRRKNIVQFGYQTIGNIDGKKVDVEERKIPLTRTTLYKGSVGDKELNMKSRKAIMTLTNKKTYKGTYNGKAFDVEFKDDGVVNLGDKTLKGTYDGKKVDIKYDYKHLQRSDKVKENSVPDDFGDVATLIFVENNDAEVREKREQERKAQEERIQNQQQQQNVQNK